MDQHIQCFFLLIILSLQIHLFPGDAETLVITNNCNYTVWPAITSSMGQVSNNDSGFALSKGQSRLVAVQPGWRGRVWGRSFCSKNTSTGNFTCQTGDCGTGDIQCRSSTLISNLATLAEFAFGQFDNNDFYDVSVANGYNLPIVIIPQVELGSSCQITGCVFDVRGSCLAELRVLSKSDGSVIGCRSPCEVFSTDQYCCNNATDCQRSDFSLSSLIFKRPCPRAYSFALDDNTSTFTCNGSLASSYNITFCPTSTISRLLSVPASQAIEPSKPPSAAPIPISPTTNSTRKPVHPRPPRISSKRRFLAALIAAAVTLILVLLGILICKRKRKATRNNNDDEMQRFANSLQYDLNTIRSATHNFAAENKLGEGGFGEVYKGILANGQEIAVKRLSRNSGQGISEFETEIILVARLQHKNLVKLLGYCSAPKESLLVYEFLPNSSLDRLLFDSKKKASLDWQTRFRIINGIAKGILYLHEDSRIKVVHRDLKSSNILLDEDMNPKIADFGLARLFGVDQTQDDTKRIVGTYGYMAPEYALTGHYSVKSDVYSFGVIVLEIISGHRNRVFGRVQLEEALLHRAWRLWNEEQAMDLIDTELAIEGDYTKEEVLKCIQIGLLCIQEEAADRPRMTSVVAALSGQAISLPIPKRPHFFGHTSNRDGHPTSVTYDARDVVYSGIKMITDVYSRD